MFTFFRLISHLEMKNSTGLERASEGIFFYSKARPQRDKQGSD